MIILSIYFYIIEKWNVSCAREYYHNLLRYITFSFIDSLKRHDLLLLNFKIELSEFIYIV